MASTLLYAFLLFYTLNTAFAIQCYQCDSSKDTFCSVGFLSFSQSVVDCSSEGGFLGSFIPKNCIKLVAIAQDGSEYVARSCGINTGPINNCDLTAKTIKFAENKNIKSVDCYTCDTDKCNSASGFSSMALAGVLAACFLFLF